MKPTEQLHELGQSLWLDNITRDLLNNGRLKSYLDELSVTGLTSNPTIFDQAIKSSSAYDAAILDGVKKGRTEERPINRTMDRFLRAPGCHQNSADSD